MMSSLTFKSTLLFMGDDLCSPPIRNLWHSQVSSIHSILKTDQTKQENNCTVQLPAPPKVPAPETLGNCL
jgi:hypothetical protein